MALIKTHQEGMDWQMRTSLEACQNNWIMEKAEMQGKNIRCKVSTPAFPQESVRCNQSILKLYIVHWVMGNMHNAKDVHCALYQYAV